MIRPYRDEDAPQLSIIHSCIYPQRILSADSFHEFVAGSLAAGGLAWVVVEPLLSGYAIVSPVPGLHGVGDLSGCIMPERQRHGLGTELLRYLLDELQGSKFRQIAHFVTDLNSPAAHFFRHHNFFLEHEEWQLAVNDLSWLPDIFSDRPVCLQTYPLPTAVSLFCQLYEESFSGLPWNQPFTPTEVASILNDTRNMLFLTFNEQAIGFAWINLDADGKALVEPLGIIPAYQRQGFGRILLLSVLQELKNRGTQRVEIGAWRNNKAALQLYQSLGFHHQSTFTYLAFNLKTSPS